MSSKDYWQKREELNRQQNILAEKEYSQKIQEIYSLMMNQIQKEINGFYAKYVTEIL